MQLTTVKHYQMCMENYFNDNQLSVGANVPVKRLNNKSTNKMFWIFFSLFIIIFPPLYRSGLDALLVNSHDNSAQSTDPCFFLFSRGRPAARWSLWDRRKDQEARKNTLLPEEVAPHHMGHLHRHQGAGGQQQRVLPRSRSQSEPAQVQFGHLPARRELGQRAKRHPRVNTGSVTRLKKTTQKAFGFGLLSSQSARGSYGVSCEQTFESDGVQ